MVPVIDINQTHFYCHSLGRRARVDVGKGEDIKKNRFSNEMQWHNSVSIVSDSDALQKCMTQSKLNEFCGQHKTKTNQYWFVHIAMGKVGNKIDEIYCYYNKLSQPTIPNEWKSSVLMKAHPSSNYDDDDDDGGGVGGVMVMMLYLPDDAHLHQLVCPNKTPICQPLSLSLSLSLSSFHQSSPFQ